MDNSNVTQLHPKDKNKKEEASLVSSLSPREIVSELDRFVVGQNKAKRAVAVALRNRWRRQALKGCLLYTSPSPRDRQKSRMPSSA